MSIDARVSKIVIYQDGSGQIYLEDRPGKQPGIAGPSTLIFKRAPANIAGLAGLNIWGGDTCIILDDVEIAERQDYMYINFTDDDAFTQAVMKAHQRKKTTVATSN